ncbi:MAG: type II secretion system protein GspM [Pseudomonadales bacterium]
MIKLEEKDRKTLMFAVPLIVLLLLYILVWRPLTADHLEAQQRLENIENIYVSWRAINHNTRSCSNNSDLGGALTQRLQRAIGQIRGIEASLGKAGSGNTQARLKLKEGDKLLALVTSLACFNLQLVNASISPDGDGGYQATIEVRDYGS